jgi:hypothetical protein
MAFRTTATAVVLLGACIALYAWRGDPQHTRLPFGTTDLSSVEKQLAKLPPADQERVKAYVKRSNGDVLPKRFADPDNPLTARTFAEAIELQRTWEAKAKIDDARIAKIRAEREAKLAPLRAVVRASVVKAEVLTRNEYQARRDPTFYQHPYRVDTSPAFLTTSEVQNLSDQTIVALRGSLEAHDTQAYLPMDLCWIDITESQSIPSGGTLELMCGHDYRTASQQQKDFASNPGVRFDVVWQPQYVKFLDGRELQNER